MISWTPRFGTIGAEMKVVLSQPISGHSGDLAKKPALNE